MQDMCCGWAHDECTVDVSFVWPVEKKASHLWHLPAILCVFESPAMHQSVCQATEKVCSRHILPAKQADSAEKKPTQRKHSILADDCRSSKMVQCLQAKFQKLKSLGGFQMSVHLAANTKPSLLTKQMPTLCL